MDVNSIYTMIGNGFRLGLHGHHHEVGANTHDIYTPEKIKMAIVGAGSLCAGAKELPRGVNRQYNIIVIDDDYQGAQVHLREMNSGDQFRSFRNGAFWPDGFVKVEWSPTSNNNTPNISLDTKLDLDQKRIHQAEQAMMVEKNYEKAIEIMQNIERRLFSYERQFYLELLSKANQWSKIFDFFQENTLESANELLMFVKALIELRNLTLAEKTLTQNANKLDLSRTIEQEIRDRLDVYKKIGN